MKVCPANAKLGRVAFWDLPKKRRLAALEWIRMHYAHGSEWICIDPDAFETESGFWLYGPELLGAASCLGFEVGGIEGRKFIKARRRLGLRARMRFLELLPAARREVSGLPDFEKLARRVFGGAQ